MKNLDLIVAKKYRLQRRIGGGSFGAVYIATHVDSGDEVAIKLEHYSIGYPLLQTEANVYRSLSDGAGIPRVHMYDTDCEYNVLVFDLLGPSLENLFNFCGREFSLKTVLMLANQLLYRLEYVHSKHIIHRDVTPGNFLMGVGKHGNQVYVTDLGLATERRDGPSKPNRNNRLIGTAYFASVNGHLGVVQHASDDMESLGYMLLYFLRSHLPWEGLRAVDQEQSDQLVLDLKQTISTEDLCKGLPKEFKTYFEHIRSLGFNDIPNYAYLRKVFNDLFAREGFEYDNVFDWTILKYIMTMQ